MEEKRQLLFTSDGQLVEEINGMDSEMLKKSYEARRELKRRRSIRAVCPYCLHISTLDKFSRIAKSGELMKKLQCPRCGAEMRLKTAFLFDRLGPKEYSEWFWEQVLTWGHKRRFDVDNVKAVIKELGFSYVFWEAYREVKGTVKMVK